MTDDRAIDDQIYVVSMVWLGHCSHDIPGYDWYIHIAQRPFATEG